MKVFQNFNPLLINPINDNSDIVVDKYKDNAWIANTNSEKFLIIKRFFNNSTHKKILNKKIQINETECEISNISLNTKTNLDTMYGDNNSIIVDMNGIDNFRFAKALIFNDYTVRKIILKMNLLDRELTYLRIGASGARANQVHPGGEVFEYSLINGKDTSGLSQSVSGYLPNGELYSKNVRLYNEDYKHLREERIVYLHTAFLKKCTSKSSVSLFIKMKPIMENQNLLDIINILAEKLEIKSYAIQMYIKNINDKFDTQIKGRVLKNMPTRPFEKLQEATDIAIEKSFYLYNNLCME